MKATNDAFQDRSVGWTQDKLRLIVGGAMLMIILLLCAILSGI